MLPAYAAGIAPLAGIARLSDGLFLPASSLDRLVRRSVAPDFLLPGISRPDRARRS